MKRSALFAFAIVGLAACETPISAPTPREPAISGPSFEVITNERIPFAFTAFNPCPPAEPVAISGEAHLVVDATAEGQRLHINWLGVKGVGLVTGASYTAEDNVKQEVDLPPPTFEIEGQEHFRLVRQGPLDNFDFFIAFRFPPFEIVRSRMECRG